MTQFANLIATSIPCSAARGAIRDRILLATVLYAMVRAGEAFAGDQSASAESKLPPSLFSTDRSFADEGFSATEFRPRKHAPAESAAGEGFAHDLPLLQGTTVWQRMAEYKSQDRVRVLTLFETRSSTLSLQAGKRFGPSLQWSSRGMNRGGSAPGLLDHLLSAALRASPSSPRPGPSRMPAAPATVKPSNLPAAAAAP